MSKHASPAVIGGFVVTAFVLLLIAIVLLGGSRLSRNTARVIVYFGDSVQGLRAGAPVKFRGIEVGSVKDVRINMSGVALDPQHVQIPVVLEIDEDKLRSQGGPRIDLNDARRVQQLVSLGLRAQLATESIVTGVRYVELDLKPGTPARLVQDRRYPEIPAVPSPMGALSDKVDRVLTNLQDTDLAGLAASLRSTVGDVDHLVRSPHLARAVDRLDAITAEIEQAMSELSKASRDLQPAIGDAKLTVTSARRATDQLTNRVNATLSDVSSAARSLRRLADQLSRDPGSILRGGKP